MCTDYAAASDTLPDKPSALIRLGLACLYECELDPRYRIDILSHHRGNVTLPCLVGFAAVVMAKRLGVAPTQGAIPANFDNSVLRAKLWALHHFSFMGVPTGLETLRHQGVITKEAAELLTDRIHTRHDVTYNPRDTVPYHAALENMAAQFDAAGY